MEIIYRLDINTIENRPYGDFRDLVALFQACLNMNELDLDGKTLLFIISVLNGLIETALAKPDCGIEIKIETLIKHKNEVEAQFNNIEKIRKKAIEAEVAKALNEISKKKTAPKE